MRVLCTHLPPKKSANGSSVPKNSLKMSKAEWKWNGVPPPAQRGREERRKGREREREREIINGTW